MVAEGTEVDPDLERLFAAAELRHAYADAGVPVPEGDEFDAQVDELLAAGDVIDLDAEDAE